MITQKDLQLFFGDFENTVELSNEEARGCLWTLDMLLSCTKFDPNVDVQEHLAGFLSRVKNPTTETYKAALGVAKLFGRRLEETRRKRRK